MPQMGHVPGASRTICGCIGHVYSAPAFGFGTCSTGAELGARGSRFSETVGMLPTIS